MARPEVLKALALVLEELDRARAEYGPMVSPHDFYGIALEEWNEWRHAMCHGTEDEVQAEWVQVVAMMLRGIVDNQNHCVNGKATKCRQIIW